MSVEQLVERVFSAASGSSWWAEDAIVRSSISGAAGDVVDTDPAHFVGMALMVVEASVAVQRGIEVGAFRRGARAGVRLTAPERSEVVRAVWRPFLHHHALPGSGMGLAVARGMANFLGVSLELREDDSSPGQMSLVMLTHVAG